MAILSRIVCEKCYCDKDVMHSPSEDKPKICHECYEKELMSEREKHFAELDELSIEERLRLVEEWIYDYKPRIPLSEMRF